MSCPAPLAPDERRILLLIIVVEPCQEAVWLARDAGEARASVPGGAAALLGRARERFSDGLSSFVHGGIQPFARHQAGYPIGLLMDLLKNSDAMGMLTLHVLSALPQQGEVVALVQTLYAEFGDMLPTPESLPYPTGAP